jgi:hypothetical protein
VTCVTCPGSDTSMGPLWVGVGDGVGGAV